MSHTIPHTATRAVRAGIATDSSHGAVVPPIHLSSTFAFEGFGKPRTYDYTRSGNPTRSQLATAIAELECGAGAIVTSTGMSAVTLTLQLVKPGELVVASPALERPPVTGQATEVRDGGHRQHGRGP